MDIKVAKTPQAIAELSQSRAPAAMRHEAQVSSAPATIALDARRWADEWSKTKRQPAYVKNMRLRATQGDPAAKKWFDCYVAAQTAINIEKCFSEKSLARASAGASDSLSLIGYHLFNNAGAKSADRATRFLDPRTRSIIAKMRGNQELRTKYNEWYRSGESSEGFWRAFGRYSKEGFGGLAAGVVRIPGNIINVGVSLATHPIATLKGIGTSYNEVAKNKGQAVAAWNLLCGSATLQDATHKSLGALDNFNQARTDWTRLRKECDSLQKKGVLTARDVEQLKAATTALAEARAEFDAAHENLVSAAGSSETAVLLIAVGPKVLRAAKGAGQSAFARALKTGAKVTVYPPGVPLPAGNTLGMLPRSSTALALRATGGGSTAALARTTSLPVLANQIYATAIPRTMTPPIPVGSMLRGAIPNAAAGATHNLGRVKPEDPTSRASHVLESDVKRLVKKIGAASAADSLAAHEDAVRIAKAAFENGHMDRDSYRRELLRLAQEWKKQFRAK